MKQFEGKVALVVAATRGIGLACAQGLAKGGATVYLGVRRMDAGQEIAEQIIAEGGKRQQFILMQKKLKAISRW